MADPKWKRDHPSVFLVNACQIDDTECIKDKHYFVRQSSPLSKITLTAHFVGGRQYAIILGRDASYTNILKSSQGPSADES